MLEVLVLFMNAFLNKLNSKETRKIRLFVLNVIIIFSLPMVQMMKPYVGRTLVLVVLVLFLNSCLTYATPHLTGWPHEHTHIK